MSDSEATSYGPLSPGRALAAQRQARGMTVTEVALRLKFSPRKIEALEAERYEELPGPAIVRGMIRGYAKLLGIDPAPLIEGLQIQLKAGPMTMRPRNMDVPFPRQPRRGSLIYVVLSVLVLITVVGVVLEWTLRPGVSARVTPPPVPAAPAPVPAAPPAAPATEPPPPAPLVLSEAKPAELPRPTFVSGTRIELVFDRESWVEIRDAGGRVVFSQLNLPGTRKNVEGSGPFSLVIGNARGVKLRYNDAEVDLAPFMRATDVARLTLK